MKRTFFELVLLFLFLFAYPATLLANTPPVSNPGGPYQGVTQKPILFKGSGSSDADGDLLTFAWDFGDKTTGTGVSPSHTYATAGVFIVALTVSDGTATNTQTTTATVSLRAPLIPDPKTGAPFVALPLLLNWEDVLRAQSYRYELIGYQENKEPKEFLVTKSQSDPPSPDVLKFLEPQHPAQWYQDECKKLKNKDENKDGKLDECTGRELREFIKQQQKRFWHAKSCEDAEGTKCGPWGEVWDFAYLLAPPKTLTPASGGIQIPVRFDWEDTPGAMSYLIKGEIDFSEGLLKRLEGLVKFLQSPETWFFKLGVKLLLEKLGIDKQAVACPYALWDETEEGCISLPINKDNKGALPSDYADDVCFFTKDTKYTWEVAACFGENGTLCGEFSEERSFQTTAGFTIPAPQLKAPLFDPQKPLSIPVVGFDDVLAWDTKGDGSECSQYHKVTITKDGEKKPLLEALDIGGLGLNSEAVKKLWEGLNTVYTWQATPCWIGNEKEIKCEPIGSEIWKFKTTGAAPQNLKSVVGNTVELTWDGTTGAGSYHYQVATANTFAPTAIKKEDTITASPLTLTHPAIAPATSYWWRVKTCADSKGEVCGEWSDVFQFSTFPLEAPSILSPPDHGQIFLTDAVTWNSVLGANFYQYRLGYACRDEKETLANCVAYNTNVCPDTSATRTVENTKIVSSNSFTLPYCMGKYTWAVRSCLDKDCAVAEPSTLEGAAYQTLTAIQPPSSGVGLVPCGKLSNEPATPYNEVEPCQFKHLGIALQNILDFVLWRVSLLVLLILAVFAGATSYFSLGTPGTAGGKPETAKKVRAMFRSFFVGFLILMFAWTFVNIVLMLFGFQSKFFGRWWELSF